MEIETTSQLFSNKVLMTSFTKFKTKSQFLKEKVQSKVIFKKIKLNNNATKY